MCSLEKKNKGGEGITTSLGTQPPVGHLYLIWDQIKPNIFLCAQGMSGHLEAVHSSILWSAVRWGAQLLSLHSPWGGPGLPVRFPWEQLAGSGRSCAWLSAASALSSGQSFAGRWPKAGAPLAFMGMGADWGRELAFRTAPAGAVKVLMVLDGVSFLPASRTRNKRRSSSHFTGREFYTWALCVCS